MWVLKSKAELQDAIVDTLEMSPINGADGLSKPIGSWDVSAVTDMSSLFAQEFLKEIEEAYKFNGDLSKWDVSSVTDMYRTFYKATAFDQTISAWNTSKVTTMEYMFEGSGLQSCPSWAVGKDAEGPC